MHGKLVNIIALDVGAQRIGVAEANSVACIAHPLTTLNHTSTIYDDIRQLLTSQDASVLVVGLPRGMQSQDTQQTAYVRDFAEALRRHLSNSSGPTVLFFWQDEALTSHKAETELQARKKPFTKGDIDALAATYILDDFLQQYNGAWT